MGEGPARAHTHNTHNTQHTHVVHQVRANKDRARSLEMLSQMGFARTPQMDSLLQQYPNDLDAVITALTERGGGEGGEPESGSSSVMPPPTEDPLPPGWKVCACTCARACAYANTYMRTPSPAIAVCVRTHTCHHGPGESTTTISSLRRRSGSAQNRKP